MLTPVTEFVTEEEYLDADSTASIYRRHDVAYRFVDLWSASQNRPGLFWPLEVARSDFGGQHKPIMGQVDWGDHGWTFALVLSDGRMFTDGVATDQGCVYIGPSSLSCQYEVVTPRHVRITMKEGKTVSRVGDIELVDQDVTQTTHRVTPSDGPPYVEKTIWLRQK